MSSEPRAVQCLISLPPAAVDYARQADPRELRGWYADNDPPCGRLGSGGGTAYLLASAWQATGRRQGFGEWLRASRKLMVHGGGQSRRLPAYAAVGKPLIPIPVMRWSHGQTLTQTLLDLQAPAYRRLLASAPDGVVAMVTSGDVLLRFGDGMPPLPSADVVALGMQVEPEIAAHFGVFYLDRRRPERLATFVQKPTAEAIRERQAANPFLVDTGMWLLSERAVRVLLERCGWDEGTGAFAGGAPATYELYAGFGLALGAEPTVLDAEIGALSCAVVALPEPEFYHLGTSRQLIESVWALQNSQAKRAFVSSSLVHPDQITQNSVFHAPSLRGSNHTLWVENAVVPPTWRLAHDHVLTGVPSNDWALDLEPGVCLDFVPVRDGVCVRAYGIDDAFAGALGDPGTLWFGRPAADWLAARGIEAADAGLDLAGDIQFARLFPAMPADGLDPRVVQWMISSAPESGAKLRDAWMQAPRLSADDLGRQADLGRVSSQRDRLRGGNLQTLYAHRASSVFYRLDLEGTAASYAATDAPLPALEPGEPDEPLAPIHDHMWRAAVLRCRGEDGSKEEERAAFAALRDAILSAAESTPVRPVCDAQSDQIVWARSPVRFDLAGGWTDTPPYCLQHGGRVVNVAVNLNGQPPIQVFAKPSREPRIVIRSIDLGAQDVIETYEQLDTFAQPGSEFALAKAALALAGFLPRFHAEGGFGSLREHLRDFGGGIEVSLLAAIPQGSGLGTSSILAATLLGALGELCGLHWGTDAVVARTLALEQMLTTGGGWQDQAGGVLRGVKLLATRPGLDQTITVRWLPEYLLSDERANRVILLYYTGLTRLAKSILHEIVRGMFLNSAERLAILRDIGANADTVAEALQRQSWEDLCSGITRTWQLKQALDSGTNPESVQAILDLIADHLAAAKLPGAGGGGYLLMFAKDEDAAARIRQHLQEHPPNDRARFVDVSLSRTGLEITRS